ncbi:hypothetical protein [uncultured Cardiobacterium sp.]|uniref:hypothetical protein n=1 Tax=uncultured Cardiobacterium sp. TaxID=417619 RepID=UPI00262EC180|nr:hypothetical protein [uncultured Cardiobacterium sp.]
MTKQVVQEKDIGLWQVLVALITDPGSRAAFKTGWKRGTTLWEAEQQAKAAESEKLRLQQAAEPRNTSDDSEGRIRCLVSNAMLEGTGYDTYSNPEIELNPYGFTEL